MVVSDKGIVDSVDISEVGVTDGLVGWWPMDGTEKDISGNANDLIINGATVASGLNGLCYYFNGTDNYAYVPYSAVLAPTSQITVSAWAYSTTWTTQMKIVSKTETGGYNIIVKTNLVSFSLYRNGTYATPGYYVTLTSGWHHIIGTYDGRYAKLYIDGMLIDTNDAGTTYPIYYTYNNALFIGAEAQSGNPPPAGEYFNGKIEDVRIYDRALSADEVNILYELGNSTTKTKISKNTAFIKGEFNELL